MRRLRQANCRRTAAAGAAIGDEAVMRDSMPFRRLVRSLCGLLVFFSASASWAIVSSNADPNSIFNGVNINQLVGAEQFYFAPNGGYWAPVP